MTYPGLLLSCSLLLCNSTGCLLAYCLYKKCTMLPYQSNNKKGVRVSHLLPLSLCALFLRLSSTFYSGRLTPVRFGSLDVSWSLKCMYKQDTSPVHKGRSPHHNWESPRRPRLSFQRVLRPLSLAFIAFAPHLPIRSLTHSLPLPLCALPLEKHSMQNIKHVYYFHGSGDSIPRIFWS